MLRGAVSRHTLKAVGQGALGGGSSSTEGMHPNLGLHSAAATGNIGLVKFALENGQPANSNLNGILPLHAACSGGSEQAVRMLLLHGADVNVPRLKSKGSGGGPGAEGSTPLHFAAANGHLEIARILLEAGARPAAADKDGVQAEALAAGNGHTDCVNLIRSWISAYGTNGLAGIVSAKEAVSRDGAMGLAGFIRYGGGQGGSNTSTEPHTPTDDLGGIASGLQQRLRGQKSFDQNGGLKVGGSSKKPSKTSSNPNLKGHNAPPTPSMPAIHSRNTALNNTFLTQDPQTASPSRSFHALAAERSPSPLGPTEEAEIAFASAVTPPVGVPGGPPSALSTAAGRESKRRPSLPSILEKAAHPAASLRAALGTGTGSSHADPQDQAPHSPNRKLSRLAGKRSLSNMLRKATGGSSVSTSTNNASLASTTFEPSQLVNLTPLRPTRPPRASFDVVSPHTAPDQKLDRRNNSMDPYRPGSEDAERWRPITAPHHLSAFPEPSSRSDAGLGVKEPRLRGSSSSSALSADAAVARHVSRVRSSSNDQITPQGRIPLGRGPFAGKASLDPLRAEHAYGLESPSTSSISLDQRTSSSGHRGGAAQQQQAYRPRNLSNLSATSAHGRRADGEEYGSHEHESSSDFASSDGSLSGGVRHRSASGSSRPTLFGGDHSTDGSQARRSYVDSTPADADDAQEFLGDTEPVSAEDAAGEHHDVHHLPAGLRTLSAKRAPRQETSAGRLPATASASSNPPSPSAVPVNRNRNRSTSSLSAVSMTSQTGTGAAIGSTNATTDSSAIRESPSLANATHALSIADEVGIMYTSQSTRPGRSGSHAESVSSRPSTSSLRSNYLSAVEQAHAILNQDTNTVSEGPDGVPLSLAAQLAAYGEALAQERKRSGDSRTGPSPSLSGRASSAALRTALPSVSEDQSPTRSSPQASRRASIERKGYGVSNVSKSSGQTYPRRSRRPHSSEGAESQSAGQRASFGTSDVGRSKTVAQPGKHVGLRNLFLDAPVTPNLDVDGEFPVQKLGSPLNPIPNKAGNEQTKPKREMGMPAEVTTQYARRPSAGTAGRASEDLLRQQRPTILTWNSDATLTGQLPKTPIISPGSFDTEGTSPRSHRHSPSAPTELSAYATAKKERSPMSIASSSSASALTSSDTPPVPPRKDSIHPIPNGLLTPDFRTNRLVGLGFESSEDLTSKRRPSWEVPRRMAHTGTDSFQSTATGHEDDSNKGGKRRMVRNFLNGIKGSNN